jgi:hypothetical protein
MYPCEFVIIRHMAEPFQKGWPMPGANPTIVSNNANTVKIYNATRSLVLIKNNRIFYYKKRSSLLLLAL